MSDPTHPTWTLPTRTPSLNANTVLKVMVAAAMACALGWYSYNQAPVDKAERQHDPGAIERFQIRNMDAAHALPGGAVRAEAKRIQDLAGREKGRSRRRSAGRPAAGRVTGRPAVLRQGTGSRVRRSRGDHPADHATGWQPAWPRGRGAKGPRPHRLRWKGMSSPVC
jgi:hypothetical protein